MSKKIGVVTVTYNSFSVLEDFFSSLEKQIYKNWELYVVDNNSKDSTIKFIQESSVKNYHLILNNSNLGFAKATNQGIKMAIYNNCDYILLLNNDIVFDENLFSTLLDELLLLNVDVLSPQIMYHSPSNKIWFAGGDFNKYKSLQLQLNQSETTNINNISKVPIASPFLTMCCALFTKKSFDSVGLLDEKYFVYIDDCDWFYNAKRLQMRTYFTPNAIMYHKVSSLTGGSSSKFFVEMYNKNMIYFLKKNTTGLYRLYAITFFIIHSLLKLLFNKFPRKYYKSVVISIYNGFLL